MPPMDEGPAGGDVAALIERSRSGDGDAARALFERLHVELRALAASVFRSQRAGHTLQPTALVNEAFLKMMGARGAPSPWHD
jgi:DNA-directed RNA polymerase specialized sigma24 family protein